MQRLVGVFDDARAGRAAPGSTTVLGSPGVGKTRLSRELCAHLAEHGDAASVELRCDRAGEATFAPVAQLIRDASGLSEDARRRRGPGRDRHAARRGRGRPRPRRRRARRARRRGPGPLGGGDVLGRAPPGRGDRGHPPARRGDRRHPVGRAAAARPASSTSPSGSPTPRCSSSASPGPSCARCGRRSPSRAARSRAVVVLDGLDASATEALAAGLLGTERLPAGLVERLPASTDGNPLFVRELVRMLVDDQVIRRRDDGEWELTIDAEAVDVPPTIQSLLGARVERLPAAEREVLEYASVVGAEFSLGALRELAGERAPIPALLESDAPQGAGRADRHLLGRRAGPPLPPRAHPRRRVPAPAQDDARRAARAGRGVDRPHRRRPGRRARGRDRVPLRAGLPLPHRARHRRRRDRAGSDGAPPSCSRPRPSGRSGATTSRRPAR